jgi:ABC-2 type transport system ATP-binding protein
VHASADGGFVVAADPDDVGRAALRGGVALTHLAPAEGAGLEQLFLELTSA